MSVECDECARRIIDSHNIMIVFWFLALPILYAFVHFSYFCVTAVAFAYFQYPEVLMIVFCDLLLATVCLSWILTRHSVLGFVY